MFFETRYHRTAMSIDERDRRILQALQLDARATFAGSVLFAEVIAFVR